MGLDGTIGHKPPKTFSIQVKQARRNGVMVMKRFMVWVAAL